jgi:hypothetical protein
MIPSFQAIGDNFLSSYQELNPETVSYAVGFLGTAVDLERPTLAGRVSVNLAGGSTIPANVNLSMRWVEDSNNSLKGRLIDVDGRRSATILRPTWVEDSNDPCKGRLISSNGKVLTSGNGEVLTTIRPENL